MSEESFCYVGVTPCGCMVAALVDRPEPERVIEMGDFIRQARKDGLTVRRVPTEEVRRDLTRCVHEHEPPSQATARRVEKEKVE